jgi:hypothetical protein
MMYLTDVGQLDGHTTNEHISDTVQIEDSYDIIILKFKTTIVFVDIFISKLDVSMTKERRFRVSLCKPKKKFGESHEKKFDRIKIGNALYVMFAIGFMLISSISSCHCLFSIDWWTFNFSWLRREYFS